MLVLMSGEYITFVYGLENTNLRKKMGRISKEKKEMLNISELMQDFRENTNVLYQNIAETRRLYELLMPSLKKSEAVKMKQLKSQQIYESVLNVLR